MIENDYTKKVLQNKYVIDLKKFLGQGSFADVHQGFMYGNEKELIAIKTIDKKQFQRKIGLKNQILNYINREKQNQLQLSSPNIVKMIDFVENDEGFYFILEYCEQGSLSNKLKSGQLPQPEIFSIFRQIVQGYKEIRQKKIIHRDLKPENILFSKGVVKIGDFGFSKLLDELDLSLPQSNLGTPLYIAPEVLTGTYSSKADVWSLGIILYRMLYGKTPLEMLNNRYQSSNNFKVQYPEDINIPIKDLNLLKRMLTEDPQKRISWEQIFLEVFEDEKLTLSKKGSSVLEIQEILQDKNNKVQCIFNYFLYIQDILKFIRQLMREISDINQIIQLSQEQQLNYSVITQKYMINELAFFNNVLQGQNMLFIQLLFNDFQYFQKSDKYEQTLQNFQQNYSYLNESYTQVRMKYDQFQRSSLRMSTENTNQVIKQVQFKLPNCILELKSNQNDSMFGETFNYIYRNIIDHITLKLNYHGNNNQIKQSLMKVLIKLFYCLQPLQFSHRILEPQTIERKLLNQSDLENEFNNIYLKCSSPEI